MQTKIKPGRDDRLIIDTKPFYPGNKKYFNILEEFKQINTPKPIFGKKIIVTVPSRLTTTIIDTNDLSVHKPGGGMLSIGLEDYNTTISMEIYNRRSNKKINNYEPVVQHTLSLINEITKTKYSFKIEIIKKTKPHIGLASSSALSLAVALGANELLSRPLKNKQLRKILGYNYVEKSGKKVTRGLNVGSSQATGLYGGVILITSQAEIVCHTKPSPQEKILVYIPKKNPKRKYISGKREIERVLNKVRMNDILQSQGRTYTAFMDLIPAIKNNHLENIGDIVYSFLLQGHQTSLLTEIYPIETLEKILMFRKMGGNICGISSGGPTIFVTGKENILKKIKKELLKKSTEKDEIKITDFSKGATITIEKNTISFSLNNIED